MSGSELLLSASLITKNEAENLTACLKSLERLVDEVVVYDTGSTDATVSIARAAGAVVIEGTWPHNFAKARNASLDRCRGRWVLGVDADEVFTVWKPERIRQRLEASSDAYLWFPILDDGSGLDHGRQDRPWPGLFQRDRVRWRGCIHEAPWPLDGSWTESLVFGLAAKRQRTSHSLASIERNLAIAVAAAEAGTAIPFQGGPS